ncbi:MAG: GNAT family N-acetyltransferase [Ktedonobacterales bacterium]
MRIGELTEADTEAYWAVRLRALREEPEAFGSSYEESKERPLSVVTERLRAITQDGNFLLGAFEDSGVLVGIVAFERAPGKKNRHIGDIFQMYVAPEARGKGYGRALMEALIARARALDGLEQLILAVVSVNTAAALYRALGFEVYGQQPRALKLGADRYLDEQLMVLWL